MAEVQTLSVSVVTGEDCLTNASLVGAAEIGEGTGPPHTYPIRRLPKAIIEAIIKKMTVRGALHAERETRARSGIGNVR
ncbi:hypothetical protein [Rhodococcus sp. 24CO]|uniref:hypothetical protein n=1 Tax=Rhodococcus sp. 24CO TaxID=3117460 RepID=UPI003D32665B